jgi:hypothetical protein
MQGGRRTPRSVFQIGPLDVTELQQTDDKDQQN